MSTFDRRRYLTPTELLPAVGAAVAAGLGVGLVVFYAARIMLQREPLRPPPGAPDAMAELGTPAVPVAVPVARVPGTTPPPAA